MKYTAHHKSCKIRPNQYRLQRNTQYHTPCGELFHSPTSSSFPPVIFTIGSLHHFVKKSIFLLIAISLRAWYFRVQYLSEGGSWEVLSALWSQCWLLLRRLEGAGCVTLTPLGKCIDGIRVQKRHLGIQSANILKAVDTIGNYSNYQHKTFLGDE